jgi:hypothetical protein
MAFALALILSALLSACGSGSRPSAKDVRASLVAAALGQKSVHYEKDIEVDMDGTTTIVADVTADSGAAQVVSPEDGVVEIRLVNGTVYINGDAAALQYYVPNLPLAEANGYSGKWISIPKGDPLYAYVSDGLTLASILGDVRSDLLPKRDKQLPTGFSREINPSGEFTLASGTFNNWNEPVHVQPPTGSTPIASIRPAETVGPLG